MNDPTENPELLPLVEILHNDRGVIIEGIAASDFPYRNFQVARGTKVRFFESGRLENMILHGDLSVNGFTYKDGTLLEFFDSSSNPSHGTLAKDTDIVRQGMVDFIFQANTELYFFLEGPICQGFNKHEGMCGEPYFFTIGSGMIDFYVTGFIHRAVNQDWLSFNTAHGIGTIALGEITFFEPASNIPGTHMGVHSSIESGRFTESVLWNIIPVQADTNVFFYQTSVVCSLGRLHSAFLSENLLLRGFSEGQSFLQAKGAYVELFEDGLPKMINLSYEQSVMGLTFKPCVGYIRFHHNGNISEFLTQYPMVVQGTKIPGNKIARFNENGELISPAPN